MLDITFSSPDAIARAFRTAMVFPAIVSAAVACILLAPRMRTRVGLPFAIIASTGVLAVLISLCYWLSYRHFVSARVEPNAISMQYPGLFGGTVLVAREDIGEVLFGLPGKSNHACTITVVTKSGARHRSAIAIRRESDCKTLRHDILRMLRLAR